MRCLAVLLGIAVVLGCAQAAVLNIEDRGAVADDDDYATALKNTQVMNGTLAALQPGDTLVVPSAKTFWLAGGIYAKGIRSAVISIDGTLKYNNDQKKWPRDAGGHVKECMFMEQLYNVTFTSAVHGVIDGNGGGWWGAISYLEISENRPRLLHIYNSTDLLVERLMFKNSPYWTFYANDIARLTIRYSQVDARRTKLDYHDLYDMTAFNTDGFDVAGQDVHIHDCDIWNDDDCIAVKEMNGNGINAKCSENMLFERINASGVGLTIGSIGPSESHTCVRNITFRDCTMMNTFKGIYMKSRPGTGTSEIRDVLYQNITMHHPTQWAIWIGPQQASYHDSCSLLWPTIPGTKCPVPANTDWDNIVLRDVTINSPKTSPGVILGNSTNPMKAIVFDNVVVTDPGSRPFGSRYYACEGTDGTALGTTTPVPPCFHN